AATALALCFPRLSWGWLAIGILAALSRALIGVHWLTDCLAGMMLGAVIAAFLYQRMIAAGHRLTTAPEAVLRVAVGIGSASLTLGGSWFRHR
ncbi:MAG: phosphatase PAP2 family protein, partial [Microgenomates group bacterium]